jgi:diguanylate cyclase (GGDEF)-like protein/PAS domain S-box-containing protein
MGPIVNMKQTTRRLQNRFGWTHRFTLRTQLAVGFAAMVALTLTAGLASYLGQQRSVNAVDRLLSVDGRIAELSMRSGTAMLKARRAEKDFLLYQKEFGFDEARSRYTTLLRANAADIRQYMLEVRGLDDSSEMVQRTQAIEQAVVQYESGFLKIVSLYGQLGHVSTGIQGRLRGKAHEIESTIGSRELDRLMIDLLMLRRHEKDFIARGQDKYAAGFMKGIDQFKTDVAATALPAARKTTLLILASEYSALFEEYVQTDARIDVEKTAYLAAAHNVEPILEELYANASQGAMATQNGVQKTAQATTWTIIAASFLAALLGLSVARLVSRSITSSVGRCVGFAKRVAEGDLTTRLTSRGQNEFATLATALNQMTEAMQVSRMSLEERAAELSKSNHALQNEILVRRHTEEQLQRVARARKVMAECNRVLVHASSESELVSEMCRTVADEGRYRMAWIGYAQHDEAKSVIPIAQAGFEDGYLSVLQATLTWADGETRNGIAGTVILTGKPTVVKDIASDPRFAPWREEALKRGYVSALGLPLHGEDGSVFGNLSIYAAEPDAFDDTEVTLLTELADDIAYGITSLRSAAARRLAEESLRLLNRAVESSVNAVLITDFTKPDNPIEYVNPAFERITGYRAADVVGRNTRFLQGDDRDQPGVWEIRGALRELREGHGVLRNYRKDGSLFWNDLHIAPVRDEAGKVTHFVGILNDITDARIYEQQLEHQANHDTLTGLPNRNLLQDRVAQSLAHARRTGERLAVLYIDLDRFKYLNDSFGHPVGDAFLKEAAARLNATVRESDTVARLGGDEFVVMVPGLARTEDAGNVAQKLLAALAAPLDVEGHQLLLTASLGVSIYPDDGDDAVTMLKNADAAMYRAKEQGGNGFQFYIREMGVLAQERVALESALRRAVEQQEFELHYQPKVSLESGQITGVEALIRWRHPELGMVSPDRFIPVAEETGLIVPIGEWVLRTACLQAKAWHAAGYPDLSMAVNLSARQFRQQNLPELVRDVLADTSLAPEHLELELTESLLMKDSESIVQALRELKTIGVTLSLDDFGTGYSSLSYLKRFPIDVVKIDRSFVRDVTCSVDAASLVKAIIAMAEALRMKTVAEGVETQGQLGFLSANQCDAIQGYYFSRPLPANEMTALLLGGKHIPVDSSSREPANGTLLLVDDNEKDLELLSHALRREGYRILSATTAREALELLATHPVGVIVSDERMPEISGVELLRRVAELYPDVVRIMLSAYTEWQSIADAINQGAVYKFLTKPWKDGTLRESVAKAFCHYELISGHKRLIQKIQAANPESSPANESLQVA